MRLKEWLKIHKNDEYKFVMYECYDGCYEKDKNGKLYITRKLVNKHIRFGNYKKYLECDIVKTEQYETESTDPLTLHKVKIIQYCCWLDVDQVKLTNKTQIN